MNPLEQLQQEINQELEELNVYAQDSGSLSASTSTKYDDYGIAHVKNEEIITYEGPIDLDVSVGVTSKYKEPTTYKQPVYTKVSRKENITMCSRKM